uniref:F-box protein At3g26010-like beta-propeller domain-containing protein n=1 Tax=Leersia perrieri TaxID=77586 RepID=A0A0D9WDD7_9ORYZ
MERAMRTARDDDDDDDQEEEELIGNDDLLVEILSRVSYKSLIRSKFVSRRNRILRFYDGLPAVEAPSLIDPSFSFLPKCECLQLLDSCNGLLLCRCEKIRKEISFVVCNPTTKKWVALPDSTRYLLRPHLGFDPVVSSHFHVFDFFKKWLVNLGYVPRLNKNIDSTRISLKIYSSKTGVWSDIIDSGWDIKIMMYGHPKSVFFNGMLHVLVVESSVVAVVDVEGKNWRTIPLPHKEGSPLYGAYPFHYSNKIDISQGFLCFASTHKDDINKLSVCVLDDYYCDQWTLHHTVSSMDLFGRSRWDRNLGYNYTLVSIQEQKRFFILYDRDQEVHKIIS